MVGLSHAVPAPQVGAPSRPATRAFWQNVVIALISFVTLVDLFAVQAILPSLARAFQVTPAEMGFAVNASTIGMAVAGISVALLSRRINRRVGICVSLALLSIPTVALSLTHDLTVFAALRVAQGLCMSAAFTLTMAYLAEQGSTHDTGSALAAYITGNVASNLFGRLMSGTVTDMLGLAPNFYLFACLNLAGAALVYVSLNRCSAAAPGGSAGSSLGAWRAHFRNPALRSAFAIGFIILFAFIGVFTYVNFVLAKAPIGLSPMALGLVYLVFIPSILTTPFAGRVVQHVGPRLAFWVSLGVAGVGLALLVLPSLIPMLIGLALVGAGTFFAQAAATGFVGHAATCDRGSASGIYLGSYYCGGLAGSALVGQVFDRFSWTASVTLIGASLALAALLAVRMKIE